jgi:predicted dehydrogenase
MIRIANRGSCAIRLTGEGAMVMQQDVQLGADRQNTQNQHQRHAQHRKNAVQQGRAKCAGGEHQGKEGLQIIKVVNGTTGFACPNE